MVHSCGRPLDHALGIHEVSHACQGLKVKEPTYIMNTTARGYTFTLRVVSVDDELRDLDLTKLP